MTWNSPPTDVLELVGSFADPQSLISLSSCSRGYREALDEHFWRKLFVQRWGQAYETKQLRSIPITDNVASWWDHVTSRLATHGREHKPRAAAAHEPVWWRACVLAHRAVPVPGRAGGQLWSDAATVRHCTICRQLSSVTRHEAACDLKAGNVVHSQSLWIRPCLCPRLVRCAVCWVTEFRIRHCRMHSCIEAPLDQNPLPARREVEILSKPRASVG